MYVAPLYCHTLAEIHVQSGMTYLERGHFWLSSHQSLAKSLKWFGRRRNGEKITYGWGTDSCKKLKCSTENSTEVCWNRIWWSYFEKKIMGGPFSLCCLEKADASKTTQVLPYLIFPFTFKNIRKKISFFLPTFPVMQLPCRFSEMWWLSWQVYPDGPDELITTDYSALPNDQGALTNSYERINMGIVISGSAKEEQKDK